MQTPPLDLKRQPTRIDQVTLNASRFSHEHGRKPYPWTGPPLDLVGPRHLIRSEKAGTPAFSAATYLPGTKRRKKSVQEATALVFDFDHLSEEDTARLFRLLEGRAFVAYTSYSHQAGGTDDCCFRVLLTVSRAILPEEYGRIWETGYAALGQLADTKTKDISRIWYVASCPPERAALAWVRSSDGVSMDVDGVLAWRRERDRAEPAKGKQTTLVLPTAPLGEGERNAGLTSLAGALRRRGMTEPGILAAISAENEVRCVPPLPNEELVAIARSVCTYDPENPLLIANRTDYGNGERLAWFARDELRYVSALERWLQWDGRRWRPDGKERVFTRAAAMVRTLAACAETVEDADEREALRRHAMRSESVSRLSSMLRVAGGLLAVQPELLDSQPWLLNCGNGTVDLRKREVRPHDRADLLTRIVPVDYDEGAACPLWERFLDRIFDRNAELIAFVQRAVGYSLTGLNTEQVLFLAVGTGANGKSTFLEILRHILGDYATNAEFSTFLKRDGDGARNDLARLAGARLVTASEPERGKPLAESLVKQLTGGDAVTVRFLFKEFFEYLPIFKVWLVANNLPGIFGSDGGIWRRLLLIPFNVSIPEAERDRDLPQKLRAELPGILSWAIRGCQRWQSEGLGVPIGVREATAEYRELMDPIPGFLTGFCELGSAFTVLAKDLYAAYLRWAEQSGEPPLSQKGLANRLQDQGLRPTRGTRGVRAWRGLRLRPVRATASSGRNTPIRVRFEEGEVSP